ncbi:MAG: hypothetical protein AAFX57_19225 [Bacteroidota bacterium]
MFKTFIIVALVITVILAAVVLFWLVVHILNYKNNTELKMPKALKWLLSAVIIEIAGIVIFLFTNQAQMYVQGSYFEFIENPQERPEIWDGIKGKYYAYNDPWTLEAQSFKSFIKIHKKRYLIAKDEDQYNFMFFIDDTETDTNGKSKGFEAFHRFILFQAKVHLDSVVSQQISVETKPEELVSLYKSYYSKASELPNTLSKITVQIINKPAPALSFFTSLKPENEFSIVYLSDNGDIDNRQVNKLMKSPNKALASHLKGIWDRHSKSNRLNGKSMFSKYENIVQSFTSM